MPRYLFSFEGVQPEDEGVELADDAEAVAAARLAARDFAQNHIGPGRTIVVYNEGGDPIITYTPAI
jgi:hypothetical protein